MTNNILCLDENYSTTRLLTQEQPEIVKREDKFETVLFLPEGEGRRSEGGLRTKGYFKKSYEDKPLISIVTVVFNGEKFLEEAIKSVISQSYDNVEYIVIDGGSTDKTVDIIKKYEDQIDYWVSEKDKGMYDGLNKGFNCATGDIFAYINADDLYKNNNVFRDIIELFVEEKYSLIFGNIEFIDVHGKSNYIYKGIALRRRLINYLGRIPFAQQTAFWTKNTYHDIGGFDSSLKYVADSKFFFNICLDKRYKYKKINKILSKFRWHDEGFSSKEEFKMSQEFIKMKKDIKLENYFIRKYLVELIIKIYNIRNIMIKKNMKRSK